MGISALAARLVNALDIPWIGFRPSKPPGKLDA
jgi:hypothetical protein